MTQEHFETKQAELSDTKLIETIETKLSKLCQTGGRSLSMSVPPQVSDIDMAICELIRRYKQLIIADVSQQRELLISYTKYYNRRYKNNFDNNVSFGEIADDFLRN